MNQMKTRLAALTLLDRAFQAMSDDDLSTVIESLPDGHVASLGPEGGHRQVHALVDLPAGDVGPV